MLRRLWAFGRLFITSPAKAAAASERPENLVPSLWIYSAVMLGFIVLMASKPLDFPDPQAAAPWATSGILDWLLVLIWQPVLQGAWIAFLLGLSLWFSKGSLPVRMASGLLWTAAPFIWMVFYTESKTMGKPLFLVGVLLWTGLFIPLLRRITWPQWRPLITYMMGLNFIGFPILAALTLAVTTRHAGLFQASQALGGLWILGVGTMGLRSLMGLRLPRAFMTLLFSVFMQFALAFSLHFLGAKGILKALFYG